MHEQLRGEATLSREATYAPDLPSGHLVSDLCPRQFEHVRQRCLGRQQSGHHQEQRLPAPGQLLEAPIEVGIGADRRRPNRALEFREHAVEHGAAVLGGHQSCNRHSLTRVEHFPDGALLGGSGAESRLQPATLDLCLTLEQQDTQGRRVGWSVIRQLAEPAAQPVGPLSRIVDHGERGDVPAPARASISYQVHQVLAVDETRLPIPALQLVAEVEREPGLARAGLARPDLYRDVALAGEPRLQVGQFRLPADQIDRLRVRAEQSGFAALAAAPGIHGEAERRGAGDGDLVVFADDLDGDVALSSDIGRLDHGFAQRKSLALEIDPS